MKTSWLIFLLALICYANLNWADDVDVNLNTNDGTTGFSVKNNTTPTPATVLRAKSDGKVGVGTTDPNHKLDVNGNVGISNNGYVNVGATDGSTGYGFRDNSGSMEYKNTGGSWTPFNNGVSSPYGFSSSTYSFAQIAYNHGNYGTTQPSVEIGADTAYETMLPVTLGTGGGTPWELIESGDVTVAYVNAKPAYLKINATGLYHISGSVSIKGTANTSIEVEVFRQNSGSIPLTTSWITGTHDLEALSTALSVTNGQYDAGSVNGFYQLNANDYLALCSRVVNGSTNTQKVICINFNVERVK